MTATTQMTELHARVTKAVNECVSRTGVSEQEAFGRHVRALMADFPLTGAAYMQWLAAR